MISKNDQLLKFNFFPFLKKKFKINILKPFFWGSNVHDEIAITKKEHQ